MDGKPGKGGKGGKDGIKGLDYGFKLEKSMIFFGKS